LDVLIDLLIDGWNNSRSRHHFSDRKLPFLSIGYPIAPGCKVTFSCPSPLHWLSLYNDDGAMVRSVMSYHNAQPWMWFATMFFEANWIWQNARIGLVHSLTNQSINQID
jgi:hypothetical protein